MTWNDATGSTSYRLQVSINTAFNQIVFEDSTIVTLTILDARGNEMMILLDKEQTAGKYEVKVD